MAHTIRLFLILFSFAAMPCQAETRLDPELATLFHNAHVEGSFVLIDGDRGETILSDAAKSRQRFVPASTFKVLNALIASETGVVEEEKEIFPWNGSPLPYKPWEHDMTLKEAMRVSHVPIFQIVARRIGLDRMREHVGKAGYGNGDIGQVVDRFWLDGPLVISALEKAEFMARLAHRTLPFSQQTQERVRRIMPTEEIGTARLYGKTGWMDLQPADGQYVGWVGWYVGWIEDRNKMAAFALNIQTRNPEDVNIRKPLALEALRHLGVVGTK
ncbi:MAG: class D beta-lactamase [Magnetococcales bacterium]|nr:class D beta-lactamase [Magnetococcales bacterium]